MQRPKRRLGVHNKAGRPTAKPRRQGDEGTGQTFARVSFGPAGDRQAKNRRKNGREVSRSLCTPAARRTGLRWPPMIKYPNAGSRHLTLATGVTHDRRCVVPDYEPRIGKSLPLAAS